MAFKERNKNKSGDNKNPAKLGIEVESVDSRNNESSTKTKPYSIPEIKSFKEQACQVLDILESRGINIYSEDRTPGMYLRTKNSNRKNIIDILSGRKSASLSQHQQQQENEQSSKPINGLLDFFNKNSNSI